MEQNRISQHLKNKQKKEKSPQRKLQSGLWEKNRRGCSVMDTKRNVSKKTQSALKAAF